MVWYLVNTWSRCAEATESADVTEMLLQTGEEICL